MYCTNNVNDSSLHHQEILHKLDGLASAVKTIDGRLLSVLSRIASISKPPSTCTQEKLWNRTDEKSQTRAKVQTCAPEGVCILQHCKFTSETCIHTWLP